MDLSFIDNLTWRLAQVLRSAGWSLAANMSSQLTAEQQRKIEENRRKALERRAQRLGQTTGTSKQPSAGFNGTTVHAQPPKQGVSLAPAAHITSNFASKRCGPPAFKKDFQSFSNQTLQPQQPQGAGSQINQNALKNSSKQVSYALKSERNLIIYSKALHNSCILKPLALIFRQINTWTVLSCLVEVSLNLSSPAAALEV